MFTGNRITRRFNAEFAVDLNKRRKWFAEGESGDQPDSATPPENNGGNQDDPNREPATDPNWLAGRLTRAQEAARKALLSDLGIDDPKEIKALIKAARDAEDAKKSDAEKATAALDGVTKERDTLKTELEAERTARRVEKRNGAIISAATDAKAQVPADVVDWAEKYATDLLAKTLKDDGTVDAAAVKTVIDKCREARRGWFGATHPGVPANGNGRNGTGGDSGGAEKVARDLTAQMFRS